MASQHHSQGQKPKRELKKRADNKGKASVLEGPIGNLLKLTVTQGNVGNGIETRAKASMELHLNHKIIRKTCGNRVDNS